MKLLRNVSISNQLELDNDVIFKQKKIYKNNFYCSRKALNEK